MAKFIDHITPVLHAEPTINDSQRADLWDLAHQSADVTELAKHLSGLNLHPMLKADLIKARAKPQIAYDNLDRAVQAVERMGKLDPKLVDLAESHKNVFHALLDSQKQAEE